MSRPSDPKKLAVWRERFERFSSCGLAVTRFCSEERVSVASFYHWRKKLGHKSRRRRVTGERDVFQQVAVVPSPSGIVSATGLVPSASAVCIELPCGTRIEVDAEHLDAVRVVIAGVARVDRGTEAARVYRGAQRTADGRGREVGAASC
jgi:hypothetical protein